MEEFQVGCGQRFKTRQFALVEAFLEQLVVERHHRFEQRAVFGDLGSSALAQRKQEQCGKECEKDERNAVFHGVLPDVPPDSGKRFPEPGLESAGECVFRGAARYMALNSGM